MDKVCSLGNDIPLNEGMAEEMLINWGSVCTSSDSRCEWVINIFHNSGVQLSRLVKRILVTFGHRSAKTRPCSGDSILNPNSTDRRLLPTTRRALKISLLLSITTFCWMKYPVWSKNLGDVSWSRTQCSMKLHSSLQASHEKYHRRN